RNAVRQLKMIWRTRKVPYTVHADVVAAGTSKLNDAINQFKTKSCIEFVPRTNEENYIQFVKEDGCWSYKGMQGGMQKVSIGDGCNDVSIIIHELLHALGVAHEQSRPDRDAYLEVLPANIIAGLEHNFQKLSYDQADTLSLPYDYDSVMHYGKTDFSKNGQNTMQAKGDPNRQLGQYIGFTALDLQKLNKLYDCSSKYGYHHQPST
ncbi:predicted protein, partial [Nematostella vectensis]